MFYCCNRGIDKCFTLGVAKLKYIRDFGHTHFHTPDTCAGSLAGQPYNLFCAHRDNEKTDYLCMRKYRAGTRDYCPRAFQCNQSRCHIFGQY